MSDLSYLALSGAVAAEQTVEIIANNVANLSTPGYKAQHLSFEQLLTQQKDATQHTQVKVGQGYSDMTEGTIKHTGAPLDVALRGPGFFVVETAQGPRLTRQGNFSHASDGTLRTTSGHLVMGSGGPVTARADLPLQIDRYGRVLSDGLYIDTLQRQAVAQQTDLKREGDSMWSVTRPGGAYDVDTQLEVGSIEQSNVSSVHEMSRLVKTEREFEQYLRLLEVNRQLQQKSASQLG
jgi:flagellar basal body rod protein FlgG